VTRLSTLLDEIDSGVVLLPEFQRGYVWNRDQVRGLMRSPYRAHPVGGLLVWETSSEEDITVRGAAAGSGTRQLLLDGQQRVTSLYGVIRGTLLHSVFDHPDAESAQPGCAASTTNSSSAEGSA